MKKYLFINTINHKLPSFVIFNKDGNVLSKTSFYNKLEKLNIVLQSFLKKQKIKPENISAILVISGPGSFTSSRGAVVIANSFNMLFNTAVLSIKDDKDNLISIFKNNLSRLQKTKTNTKALVYYDKEPNITI